MKLFLSIGVAVLGFTLAGCTQQPAPSPTVVVQPQTQTPPPATAPAPETVVREHTDVVTSDRRDNPDRDHRDVHEEETRRTESRTDVKREDQH